MGLKLDNREYTKLKLEKLWEQENKRPFVYHLMYSYLPSPIKAVKLFSWKDSPNNISHQCALTKESLFSLEEIIGDLIDTENKDILFSKLFTEQTHTPNECKKCAYRGDNTDTVLSLSAILGLNDWVEKKLLISDKDITNTITKLRLGAQKYDG